ncbi:UDP-2,3-diacylglucosamine diphosphatase [Gammaproteobacteria bacterium]|nr:UDP-2,3-diacylglucosamine diphosphatase [Gammaproteobacteria bacterium]
MTTIFISDLHLDKDRPKVIRYFIDFLNNLESDIESLYILGDFVEYWVGDDDPGDGLEEVFSSIKKKSNSIPIYFMHGNRDFMISEKFCNHHGMKFLKDPTKIKLHGKKILLMHGDTLCVDDIEYQKFRTMVRSPLWQNEMLKKSLKERINLAKMLRAKSLSETGTKDEVIMDVSNDEVISQLKKHDVDMIIHGHTHRPNIHKIISEDREYKRIVLGDWYDKSFILRISDGEIIIDKSNLS